MNTLYNTIINQISWGINRTIICSRDNGQIIEKDSREALFVTRKNRYSNKLGAVLYKKVSGRAVPPEEESGRDKDTNFATKGLPYQSFDHGLPLQFYKIQII